MSSTASRVTGSRYSRSLTPWSVETVSGLQLTMIAA
jgi:hypothetical protein